MSKDTNEIVVGANGTVRVAPLDADEPASIDIAFSGDWVDLGYTSEDGVTVTDAKTVEDIPVWQLFYPARKIVTSRDFMAAFVLRQFSGPQVEFAFGGGAVTVNGEGFRYTPPSPEELDIRKLAVEWLDGDKTYRLIVTQGIVTENVETKLVRNAAADLPITFGGIGQAGIALWYLDTDDETFSEST